MTTEKIAVFVTVVTEALRLMQVTEESLCKTTYMYIVIITA